MWNGPMPGSRLRPGATGALRMARCFGASPAIPHSCCGAVFSAAARRFDFRTRGEVPMNWFGVMPAVTTPFDKNLSVDHEFLARHASWLLENGCTGLVMLGSLGEGATLEHEEKIAILKTAVKTSN